MEIKEREVIVKIEERVPFAVRATYSETHWAWLPTIEGVYAATDEQPERRVPVGDRPDLPFANPYECIGGAVEWLLGEIESGRFDIRK